MRAAISILLVLALVSMLSAQCANLSDSSTWGTKIVNDTGVLYINENTSICRDTYYLNAPASTAMLQMNTSNIFLDCNQSVIDGVDDNGYGIYMTGKENNTIENCTIRNYEYGIYLNGAKYNRLAFNTAYSNPVGIYVASSSNYNNFTNNSAYSNTYHGFLLQSSSNNILTNNSAYSNTYYGFVLYISSNNNILTSNTAYSNSRGFDLESSSNNNTLTNNSAYNGGYGFLLDSSSTNILTNNTAYSNFYGFLLYLSSNNNILTNNTAYSNTIYGFLLQSSSNNNILTSNTAYSNGNGFYLITSSDYNTLNNNSAYSNSYGFYLYASYYNNFTNNSAYSNTYHGFYLAGGNDNNILTNNSAYSNTKHGFYLSSSSSNILTNNSAYSNLEYGFLFYPNSNYNTLTSNTAYNNSQIGFILYSSSNYNNLTNNPAYNNSYDGFYLYSSSSNTLTNNSAYNNSRYGFYLISSSNSNTLTSNTAYNNSGQQIYLQTSSSNLIYNNNFTGALVAYDDGTNRWNTSKTLGTNIIGGAYIGGNWYSNYTGVDTDGDGIGETTYAISGGSNIDYLPLTNNLLPYTGCANLSDSSTWGTKIVNVSGVLYVNENTTLCRDTYNLNAAADTPLLQMNSSNIFLDCNLSIIDGTDGDGYGIYMTGKENDTIMNCTVRNYAQGFYLVAGSRNNTLTNDFAYNNNNGFNVLNSAYNNISNSAAFNNTNDGFQIYTGSNYTTIRNSLSYNNTRYGFFLSTNHDDSLTNNTAYNNSQHGILLFNSDYNTVQNVYSFSNMWAGIDLYASSYNNVSDSYSYDNGPNYGDFVAEAYSNQNRFNNDTAYGNQNGFLFLSSSYNSITNSLAYSTTFSGFWLFNASYTNLTNNTAYNFSNRAYYISNLAENNTLLNNTARDNAGNSFVVASNHNNLLNNSAYNNTGIVYYIYANYTTLRGNTAYNNSVSSFYLGPVRYNTLADNLAYNNPAAYAFALASSSYNNLTNNTAYNNSNTGFYLLTSSSNSLTNNLAYDNDAYGFLLLTSAENNTLTNNTAYDSTVGFSIDASNYNNLTNNIAYNNSNGFLIYLSDFNTLINSLAYGSSASAFSLSNAESNTLINSTARDNPVSGINEAAFRVFQSSYNNFTDTLVFNNSGYGIYIYWVSMSADNNLFTNTFIYNHSQYIEVSTTGQNNFTNLTLGYNASIGLVNYFFLNVSSVDLFTDEADFSLGTMVLREDWVSLDDSSEPQANVSANITISTPNCLFVLKRTGFPTSRVDILNFGRIYDTNLTCIGAGPYTAIFNVTGFSGYAVDDYTACVNLSDSATWGAKVVNDTTTGVLYVNDNTTLCTDTYYLNASPSAPALQMNASGIYLNCNDSIIDGVDGDGYGISFSLFGLENGNTIGNCTVANYDWGFVVTSSNDNTLIDNVARDITSVGFRLGASSNNKLINNTARDSAGYGFIVTDGSQNNTLIDNVAFNHSQYGGLTLAASAYYNNITNMFIYNQSSFVTQYDTGGPSNNFTNLTLGYNETIGLISFGFINATNMVLYQYLPAPAFGTVYLQPDFVYLNDTSALSREANVSANITVSTDNCSKGVLRDYDVPLTLADILDTGTHYPTTLSCADGIARFEVLGFSGYAIGEEITYLSLSMQPDTTVLYGTETNVSCNASNFEVNLTLYRDGGEVNSSFSSVQDMATLAQGAYFYECNATGDGNYTSATTSGTLNVVTCTNISSPMEYTLTYDLAGYRTYGITDACVYIESSDVTLNCDGYSITGDGSSSDGIYIVSALTNVNIGNCSVSNYTNGMYVLSDYGTIANNDVFNNTATGMTVSGSGNNVSSNLAHNNTDSDISITGTGFMVFNNSMYGSTAGIGLFLAADYNTVLNNTIFGNYYGAYFNSAAYTNFTGNRMVNNTLYGLYLSELAPAAGYNNIINNTIANNSLFQIFIDDSYDNLIYNNIVNASGSQGVISSNTYEYWNTTKTLQTNIISGANIGGNFYSNYTGLDTDGDGIGEIPYVVNSYNSIDYLPLTNNINYAPFVNITSIGGQANDSEITSLTPAIVFNATDLDNSTLNCTIYVDGTIAGGTNESVLNGTLTSITLNYSLTAGQSYNFTINCSDGYSTVASGTWVETVSSPSPPPTPSSSNPSIDEPLSITASDEVPQGSEMLITVKRENVTISGAKVVITFGTTTVLTAYTDAWGRVFFTPAETGLYRITATKFGFTAANDSFVAAAPECLSNNDCAYNEACTDGACTQVPEGECGTYSNHAWEDYACCASSDCGTGFQCTNHECVQREARQGCTLDSECQQGYRCASGTCVQVPRPQCTTNNDCLPGFACNNTVCVQRSASGGPVTSPTSELKPSILGSIIIAIANLWWLLLILALLVIWYFYRKSREKKA